MCPLCGATGIHIIGITDARKCECDTRMQGSGFDCVVSHTLFEWCFGLLWFLLHAIDAQLHRFRFGEMCDRNFERTHHYYCISNIILHTYDENLRAGMYVFRSCQVARLCARLFHSTILTGPFCICKRARRFHNGDTHDARFIVRALRL